MEVTLNKNGWHKKLLTFCFGDLNEFNNFCPYFWLVVFCLLFTFIIPVIPLYKLVKYLFSIIKKVIEFFLRFLPESDKTLKGVKLINYWLAYNLYNDRYKKIDTGLKEAFPWFNYVGSIVDLYPKEVLEKMTNEFIEWKNNTPNWLTILEHTKEYYKQKYLKKKNKQRFQDKLSRFAVKYTKYILGVIAVGFFILLGYLCIIDINNLIAMLLIVGVIIIVVGLITGFVKIASWLFSSTLGKFAGNKLVDFLTLIVDKVLSFFSFFIDFVKTKYEDSCPPINWKD